MDKIVEAILKLQPFGIIFKKLGCNDDWSALFSVLLITGLLWMFVQFYKDLRKRYIDQKKSIEDIKPQFDHLSIKKAKKYYIQTQYQNAAPSRQEKPGFTHKYIARNKLIPFFINTAFNQSGDSERFYLILADSGMGKTTFMFNLYLAYHSFFCYSRQDKMKLLRFSNPDTIDQIKSVKTGDVRDTILLLDALDEDLGIISTDPQVSDAAAFQHRIDEIIDLTKKIRAVLITCRTQYFPGQEEDPYELKIKRPDEKGFYILNKLYISPFTEKEVRKYLNKKFGVIPFINQKKKKRAHKIVSQAKNLVMRPMLLSYIDYLIEDELTTITTYNIYDTLVTKWLHREADKRVGVATRGSFIIKLHNLSFKTAIAIYTNWRKEGRMYLTKEEALGIAKQFAIELKPEEITGQSLLTCDGIGNWKFAHKSILEFFLAIEAFQNLTFLKVMNFKGMDMARKFFEELYPRWLFLEHQKMLLDEFFDYDAWMVDHYIYKSPIHEAEFLKIVQGIVFDLPALPLAKKCSFKDALAFCNEMNRRHGYSPVYDLERKRSFGDVRGFRLPTATELKAFLIQESHRRYYEKRDSGEIVQIIKNGMKFIFTVEDEVDNIPTLYTREWCLDVDDISVFGWKKKISLLQNCLKFLIVSERMSRMCRFSF